MRAARPGGEEERAELYVFVCDLADHLGRSSTAIVKKARRLRVPTVLVRREESGKAALAILADGARKIIEADVKTAETISPADLMKG